VYHSTRKLHQRLESRHTVHPGLESVGASVTKFVELAGQLSFAFTMAITLAKWFPEHDE
jgi:hypothetical protein